MTFNFYETEVGKQQAPVDVNAEYCPHELTPKKYPKGSKVVVIDGDILSYKVSAACESRGITATKNGKTKPFKNRTEFKKLCEEKNWEYLNFTIEETQVAEDISYCIGTLKRAIENIVKRTGATHYEIYVEGKGNHRLEIPLKDKYKDRESSVRPVHLKACKEYLIKHKEAKRIKGRETDDYFQQRLYELSLDGTEALGYSNDKDSKQNYQFDITLYNPDDDSITTYKKGVGDLWESSNGIKGSGLKWLVFQNMLYDKVDCYCMNQFYLKRYGEKSFYKDFKDLKTEQEVFSKAVSKLKEMLPEKVLYTSWNGVVINANWLELTELYFQACYMKISDDDQTTFESLLKEYGVEY